MISNRPLGTFFLYAFSFTWGWMFLMYGLFAYDFISPEQLDILNSFAYLGPFFAAIITAKIYYGKNGRRKLLKSMFAPVPGNVLLFAFTPLLFLALAFIVYKLRGGRFYGLYAYRELSQLPPSGLISIGLSVLFYGLMGEIGWRGFALPHLQQRAIAMTATIIVAFFSAIWFLPIFYLKTQLADQVMVNQMLLGFFCSLVSSSVILTHLYNSSKGSVLACTIFQFCVAIASVFSDRQFVIMINAGLLTTSALLIWGYKAKNLSGQRRISTFFGENYL